MKYLYFGSAEFSASVLEKLIREDFKPLAVITNPDKPVGRDQKLMSPLVKTSAEKNGIEVLQPINLGSVQFIDKLNSFGANFFVLVAYGRILPKEIINLPPNGIVGVHPSLLPKLRGPSPIQTCIMEGLKNCGTSVFLLDEKVDHGPILASIEYNVSIPDISYKDLSAKIADISGDLLVDTLNDWDQGKIEPKHQDDLEATYTNIFKFEDGALDPNQSATYLERQVRALSHSPGTYIYLSVDKKMSKSIIKATCKKDSENICKLIKIWRVEVKKGSFDEYEIGEIFISDKEVLLKCAEDTLKLIDIQPAGKKNTDAYGYFCNLLTVPKLK